MQIITCFLPTDGRFDILYPPRCLCKYLWYEQSLLSPIVVQLDKIKEPINQKEIERKKKVSNREEKVRERKEKRDGKKDKERKR